MAELNPMEIKITELRRQIVQIQIIPANIASQVPTILALCSDGSIWAKKFDPTVPFACFIYDNKWTRIQSEELPPNG